MYSTSSAAHDTSVIKNLQMQLNTFAGQISLFSRNHFVIIMLTLGVTFI